MLIRIVPFLLLSLSLRSQTAIVKNDFAFERKIAVEKEKSVIDVILLDDVYQTTKNNSLADLAVFNSKNELVPHTLVRSEAKVVDKSAPPADLTAFPVMANADDASDHFSDIKVTTTTDGSIAEIHNGVSNGSSDASAKKTVGYLVDSSKIKNRVEKLKFDLADMPENTFVYLKLEGSQDLKAWTVLENDAVLAKFEVNGEKVTKDEVAIQPSTSAYYRMSWKKMDSEFKIKSVRVEFSAEKEKQDQAKQWFTRQGTKITDPGGKVIYQYDLGGYYPVSGFKFQFADQNSVARVTFRGSNSATDSWLVVDSAIFYTLKKDEKILSQLQTDISPRSFRYWQVELASGQAGVGSQFPEVSFGWLPDSIRFLARGQAPFVLAYGSSKAVNFPQVELVNTALSNDVGIGTLGEKSVLGGADRLIVEVPSDHPWKKIILWLVLFFGVVLLGSMAYQVKKQ